MRKVAGSLVVSLIAFSSLLAACGGDDDDSPAAGGKGGNAGATSTGGAKATGGAQGTGGANATGGAQSSGGRTGGGTTTEVTIDTPLSDIDTDAEAQAVCEMTAERISEEDTEKLADASCTFAGLIESALGSGDCETAKEACIAEGVDQTQDCDLDEVVPCEDVTVGELLTCQEAMLDQYLELLSGLTCESELSELPTETPPPPDACKGPFQRCPELAESLEPEAE